MLFASTILVLLGCAPKATSGVEINPEAPAAAAALEAPMSQPTQAEKARQLLESLESGDPAPVAYINPAKYIQHNLDVARRLEKALETEALELYYQPQFDLRSGRLCGAEASFKKVLSSLKINFFRMANS